MGNSTSCQSCITLCEKADQMCRDSSQTQSLGSETPFNNLFGGNLNEDFDLQFIVLEQLITNEKMINDDQVDKVPLTDHQASKKQFNLNSIEIREMSAAIVNNLRIKLTEMQQVDRDGNANKLLEDEQLAQRIKKAIAQYDIIQQRIKFKYHNSILDQKLEGINLSSLKTTMGESPLSQSLDNKQYTMINAIDQQDVCVYHALQISTPTKLLALEDKQYETPTQEPQVTELDKKYSPQVVTVIFENDADGYDTPQFLSQEKDYDSNMEVSRNSTNVKMQSSLFLQTPDNIKDTLSNASAQAKQQMLQSIQ